MIIIIINQYINAISSINLFRTYREEELNKLFSSTKFEIKEYGKEQIIHLQNELCKSMDILLEGKVSVQKIDESGNVFTINVFTDREIIGANLIFSSRNYYPMTVVAASNAIILHLHKELLLELCQNNVNFMADFLKEISDRTAILADKINAISLKTIRQQIIDFLEYESNMQKTDVVKLHFSKKDLAERLGIQRTSLSRELNKMRKEGLVEYDARTITLKKSPINNW